MIPDLEQMLFGISDVSQYSIEVYIYIYIFNIVLDIMVSTWIFFHYMAIPVSGRIVKITILCSPSKLVTKS